MDYDHGAALSQNGILEVGRDIEVVKKSEKWEKPVFVKKNGKGKKEVKRSRNKRNLLSFGDDEED